jgi:DNA-binding regulatory protein, YebC/PmpR family
MAGHSKWDNIKHKKAKEDARRGKLFTKMARLITVAAREGGPDPSTNFRLRLAIDKARSYNVPNENIERAIKRAVGGTEGDAYEELIYEGYGPGGVAVMLQIMTDNRNRTAADIRHLFSKYGGNLGESGCVAWMFERKGEIRVNAEGVDEDELMMAAVEAGAEDVEVSDGVYTIWTEPESYQSVQEALSAGGWTIESAGITMRPKNTVSVEGENAKKLLALLDALEDHDDVQDVYANLDISEEALQAIQN